MKVNIFLAILFAAVTSFTALHEVEHIHDSDGESCLIAHVNNLTPVDVISSPKTLKNIHFEAIKHTEQSTKLYCKQRSNQNRAPPSLS
ncbi:MAG: hypothetical protein Q9M43_14335 [Sulfurimonas sp.]|nr:hypothetical protein [Sulfurimonas sp.]